MVRGEKRNGWAEGRKREAVERTERLGVMPGQMSGRTGDSLENGGMKRATSSRGFRCTIEGR